MRQVADPFLRNAAIESERHPHLGPVADPSQELDPVAQRLDQGQAEALKLASGIPALGPDARALVGDDDLELGLPDAQVYLHRALVGLVGVNDDVVARLAHGRVDVEKTRVPELEHLHHATERLADYRYVLRSAGHDQPELGFHARPRFQLHARTGQSCHSWLWDWGRSMGLVRALPPSWAAETASTPFPP